jgi:hypothetical protein
MTSARWIWGLALIGCGSGATPPAASPTAPSPSSERTPAESSGESKAKPAAETPKDESQGSAASAEELTSILQRVIEDEELDKYLKLTLPGRFPLKIAGTDLPSGISLIKGTKPVVIVAVPDSKKDAVLVLTTVEISGKEATVAYRYDVEGIRGTARLKKGERGWELKNSRIVEH